jgi:hypothetical protein
MALDETRWMPRERPVTRIGCPLYFNNPAASVLGSGKILVLDANTGEQLLGEGDYLRRAQQNVRDGRFAVRRGPVSWPNCDDWYVFLPRYPHLRGPVPPVALPLGLAVSANVVPPELYEARMSDQWSEDERTASAAEIESGAEFSARTDRQYWAAQPGLLGLMAAEARKLANSFVDLGSLWGPRVLLVVGAVLLLGIFSRGKG